MREYNTNPLQYKDCVKQKVCKIIVSLFREEIVSKIKVSSNIKDFMIYDTMHD